MKKIVSVVIIMLIAGLAIFTTGRVANTGPPTGLIYGLVVDDAYTGNIDLNYATWAVTGEFELAPLARDATLVLNKFATIHGSSPGLNAIGLVSTSGRNIMKIRKAASESYLAGNNQGLGDINKIAQITENTGNRRVLRA